MISDEVIPLRLIAFALMSSAPFAKKVSGWLTIQPARTKRGVMAKVKNRAAAQILRWSSAKTIKTGTGINKVKNLRPKVVKYSESTIKVIGGCRTWKSANKARLSSKIEINNA
jgi:hypothetical protein